MTKEKNREGTTQIIRAETPVVLAIEKLSDDIMWETAHMADPNYSFQLNEYLATRTDYQLKRLLRRIKGQYLTSRNRIEKLSQKNGLKVADMPMVIQAMTTHPAVREAIRPCSVDTITGEYHGQRDGDRSYEVWHSAGSLATAKGLKKLFSKTGDYGFMPISDDEWVAVGNGSYNGQTVARVHLEDAKKGNVPSPGTPYSIFVRLDKDKPKIISNKLDYDTFMQDDRVLMITGSPESREALAKMLFGEWEEGGEGLSKIDNYHRINAIGFDAQAKGRLAYLDRGDYGLFGDRSFVEDRRFVGVGVRDTIVRTENNLLERVCSKLSQLYRR